MLAKVDKLVRTQLWVVLFGAVDQHSCCRVLLVKPIGDFKRRVKRLASPQDALVVATDNGKLRIRCQDVACLVQVVFTFSWLRSKQAVIVHCWIVTVDVCMTCFPVFDSADSAEFS